MRTDILHALTDSIDRREAVALVTVTAATGIFAASLGRDAVLWPEEDRDPIGCLGLGNLTDRALSDTRQVIREKSPRHLHYVEADGSVSLFVDVTAAPTPPDCWGVAISPCPRPHGKAVRVSGDLLDDRSPFANTARFPA